MRRSRAATALLFAAAVAAVGCSDSEPNTGDDTSSSVTLDGSTASSDVTTTSDDGRSAATPSTSTPRPPVPDPTVTTMSSTRPPTSGADDIDPAGGGSSSSTSIVAPVPTPPADPDAEVTSLRTRLPGAAALGADGWAQLDLGADVVDLPPDEVDAFEGLLDCPDDARLELADVPWVQRRFRTPQPIDGVITIRVAAATEADTAFADRVDALRRCRPIHQDIATTSGTVPSRSGDQLAAPSPFLHSLRSQRCTSTAPR